MIARAFVDTNVFLYSIDEEPASAEKRRLAQQLLFGDDWGWSVQVAAEFYVNATSLRRQFRLKQVDAVKLVEYWFRNPTQEITPDVVRGAFQIQHRYNLSYWDAAILSAAKKLGCATVYSEDLNAGQVFDGVTVVNPFVAVLPSGGAGSAPEGS